MSRDKQTEIHEIAKRMSEAISTEMELRYISDERKLEAALKENGWCKASDLAEEIFAEINDLRDKYAMGDIEYPDFQFELGKIEKKYTEGEG